MSLEQGVEQRFGAFLQGAQILVFGDGIGLAQKAAIDPFDLLFQRVDLRWQQAVQPQRHPLVLGERGALVAEDQPQQGDALQVNFHVITTFGILFDIEIRADRFSFHRVALRVGFGIEGRGTRRGSGQAG